MNSLLRVEHVTISYNGKPMVEDVSFEVKQGEILGIVGESGSGKSTIIKAIMGLLGEEGLVTRGDIWYKGENLTDMSEKKLRKLLGTEIGMVFQDCKAALCPVRTIGAQIYEAVSEHEKISKKEVRKHAGEIMKKSVWMTVTVCWTATRLNFGWNEPKSGNLYGHDPASEPASCR